MCNFMATMRTQIFSVLIIPFCAFVVSCSDRKIPACFDEVVKKNYNDHSDTLYFYVMNDLERGVECAKTSKKNLLLIFSAARYSSVKDAEWRAVSYKRINTLINENFVTVFLPTDDSTSISDTTSISLYTGKNIKTKGEKNLDTQFKLTNSNTVTLFVVADTSYKVINTGFFYNGKEANTAMFDFLENSISSNKPN